MKKTRSKKSRDTVPLSVVLNEKKEYWAFLYGLGPHGFPVGYYR
jgi:hypothetical protein